jgi:AraC-like DNA-binding protein
MTAISYMGIGITIFSVLLALSKRPNQISDKLLALFLLSIIFPMLVELGRTQPLFILLESLQPTLLNRMRDFLPLTLGPFMTLYVESLTQAEYALTKRRLCHFLPFFTFLMIAISAPQYTAFTDPGQPLGQIASFEISYLIVLLASLTGYSVWLQSVLTQHRKRVFDYFAQNPNPISLMWLTWIVYLFFVVFVIVHILRVLILLDLFASLPDFISFFESCHIPFLCLLSFFGVRQSQVFKEPFDGSDEIDAEVPVASTKVQEKEPATSVEKAKKRPLNLPDDLLEDYLSKLESFVKLEKPYLNSDLTLGDLAKLLDMPKHHLTETLNRKLQKNFYSYVNECRITEFKALLQDPQNSMQTIMSLAYQVGFNSKSAFNTFFKKSTQMTPTQFRKLQSDQQ